MHLPSGVLVAGSASALTAVPSVVALVRVRRRSTLGRGALQLLAGGAGLAAVAAAGALAVVDTLHGDGVVVPAGRHAAVAAAIAVAVALAGAALLIGMVCLPAVSGDGQTVLRHLLDAVVVAAALWFVGWVLLTEPTRVLGRHTPQGCGPAMLPAGVTALAVGLTVIAGLRGPRPRAGAVAVGAGITLVTAAGTGLSTAVCQVAPPLAVASALLLPPGVVVLAVAVRWSARGRGRTVEHLPMGAYAFLPMAGMSVAATYHTLSGGKYGGAGIGAGIIEGFALVGRQYLALLDVRRYARRLIDREAHFRELAHTDPLTGLANRRGLLRALREVALGGPPCVLMGLDLDGFKNVNDMRGHDVGDGVLIEVAQRLRRNLRPGDLAARLGGDEFAVLMWTRPAEAQRVAERLLTVLSKPYEQEQGTVFLSASIGLAGGGTARDVPGLLRNADLALRYAKQRGKGRVEQYDVRYDQLLRRRTTLEHELRGAIERDELHLAYQPVVALPSVRPVGAEALLRWRHPVLGQVPPDEFIPVAEESGVIDRLGRWVLHQACRQLSRWLADGHDVWVSVNVSPRELHSPEYVGQVADALRLHRVPPQRLVLEVTEQAVATDLDELVSRLRALRTTGVRVALDDFGAGYSSLGQLRKLPVDILKVDQSLVAEPEELGEDATPPLVDVVVRLGHRLGLEVIAEGLATPEHRATVEVAGCRWGQGRLFGAPVPGEHMEALLVAASGAHPREAGSAPGPRTDPPVGPLRETSVPGPRPAPNARLRPASFNDSHRAGFPPERGPQPQVSASASVEGAHDPAQRAQDLGRAQNPGSVDSPHDMRQA